MAIFYPIRSAIWNLMNRFRGNIKSDWTRTKVIFRCLQQSVKKSENWFPADFNRYPDPLAAGLCRQYAAVYGISADNLTVGDGSDELISILNG